MKRLAILLAFLCLSFSPAGRVSAQQNLVPDPSFEEPKPKDQFGGVFAKWGGWKYEGDCEFRVGQVAHTGKTSALLFGASQPKIRITQTFKNLEPGRYKITAYIRGVDIGEGVWRQTTEFMFDGKYMPLKKNGTFGWTPLTYVVDVTERKEVLGPSFGLMAPGWFWIDDVALVRVGNDVPVTPEPVLGKEEKPIAPPGDLGPGAVRCAECGYRNMPAWKACYACGAELTATKAVSAGPAVKVVASFEEKSPFQNGQIVAEHATEGQKAWRIDKSYSIWDGKQDWSGYDYLKADVFVAGDRPLELYVEIRDDQTRDYWTRVNYNTLLPPGKSTLVLPLEQLYVGEKSRPGRKVILSAVNKFVLSVGDNPPGPLFVDNIRLERDVETPKVLFPGLFAFDFGPSQGPLMPGFTRIDPSTLYSKGRGYGLKDAQIWRSFDALQPEPLYQDFICIEKGGLAVDVPNGKYHVFVNIDSPSGFWGEYQVYRNRAVLAEGKKVVDDQMTLATFKKKYFRFWDVDDSPADDTFEKYQRPYFTEKEFDVDVADGQLNLEFQGANWACSVSAVVIFPVEKTAEGKRFLDHVTAQRKFFFDNYFHRILHKPTGDPLQPSAEDARRGFVVFTRDYMDDVYYNDTPTAAEVGVPVRGEGFAGEHEPLTVAICPLKDLGPVTVAISDLKGPGKIPASAVSIGQVSYRLSRVAMDGTVYTIEPRIVLPLGESGIDVRKGVARRFWLTICPPDDTPPGVYRGTIRITPTTGAVADVPVEYRVYRGTLDEVDVPVGPWGHEINLPWLGEDPATQVWNQTMAKRSMARLRQYGFTTLSGLPQVTYLGMKDGKPQFDFSAGDRQMAAAREAGFKMPVVSYTHFGGLNLYFKDEAAMRAAGFSDYSKFIKTLFSAVQEHAEQAGWLPVYWNLGDEPIGDDLVRAAENAEAYRAAFPKGPPLFTAATSFESGKADDPHFRFGRAVHAANLNVHSEQSVRLLQQAGGGWGFYNGGNRWTYGVYLYKAAKEFDLKFRLSWHWNVVAGDPYYALDCREDDYAWCNTNPRGELLPSVHFERDMREGLDDYRYLLTLARLAEKKSDAAGKALIAQRMQAFKLGQREHDALFPKSDWRAFRRKVAVEIERLRASN